MNDSMYNSLRIPATKGTTTTTTAAIDTAIPHNRQKRAAPKIISPNNHSKPSIRNKLLPAPLSVPAATTRTIQTAPPKDAVYVPTFYVHILLDGVLNHAINDDVTPFSNNNNNTSTTTKTGFAVGGTSNTTSIQYHDSVTTAGAGALVTIFSIPPPQQQPQSSASSASITTLDDHVEMSVKSYRIRQYYDHHRILAMTTKRHRSNKENQGNVDHHQHHSDTMNRHSIYYIALSAALRVVLKHMQDIQPLSTSNDVTPLSLPKKHLSPQPPLPPPVPYFKIHKLQIEGSCSRLIMDTIRFLSYHPITGTTTTTTTTISSSSSNHQYGSTSFLDPTLQRQFDACHILLRQLSYYYCTTDSSSSTSSTTNTNSNGLTAINTGSTNNTNHDAILGLTIIEPEWNRIPKALSIQAIQERKSWMTTSDDYHNQCYPLPTTVIESLTYCKKRSSMS